MIGVGTGHREKIMVIPRINCKIDVEYFCEVKTSVLVIGILLLDIIWNLELGAWDLQIFSGITIVSSIHSLSSNL